MSQLPKGWVGCKLGDVVDYGKTVKADMTNIDDDAWVLELEDLEKDSSKILQRVSFGKRKPKSAKNAFKAGDVLYGKLRPYLNKMVVAPEDGICTSEIIPLKVPTGLVDNRYLFYWLKGRIFGDYVNAVSYGVNMPRLGTKDGLNAPMVLAPTAEQTRIVEKLDEVLAQVDTIKARLDGIPAILKRFRQSVLAAAVSGRLTEEWRGTEPTDFNQSPITVGKESINSPDTWAWTKLLDLAKLESGHTPRKTVSEYWENGDVYWICLQDIRAAHGKIIEDTKFKPTMKGIENSSARLLPKGTVCFSRDISVGFTTIMGKEMSTTQHFANWICGKQLFNKYLMFALMAAKRHLTDTGQGTTVKTIYMPALKDFYLLTPPIEEQKEIVRLVDQYFAFADTIEAQVKKAQARVDKLTQSILAKAFRGELVAQDPGDEPADKLLERIAAARAEADALAKTAKKVGRKQATA
ncbi:restriction endonuclease subunit S [Shewanella algae]|uniref:restriction endonuclease subunit S n=1 Tax=Shewanella algae TaxID=38313 RepID=UPI0031F4F53E